MSLDETDWTPPHPPLDGKLFEKTTKTVCDFKLFVTWSVKVYPEGLDYKTLSYYCRPSYFLTYPRQGSNPTLPLFTSSFLSKLRVSRRRKRIFSVGNLINVGPVEVPLRSPDIRKIFEEIYCVLKRCTNDFFSRVWSRENYIELIICNVSTWQFSFSFTIDTLVHTDHLIGILFTEVWSTKSCEKVYTQDHQLPVVLKVF